jgi:hypothetical protein
MALAEVFAPALPAYRSRPKAMAGSTTNLLVYFYPEALCSPTPFGILSVPPRERNFVTFFQLSGSTP